MCGLCGFIVHNDSQILNGMDEMVISGMTDQLTHRGPDFGNTELYHSSDYTAGLGHRRLSIIDLSASGNQPMHNERRDCAIVFNGEIYNFKELSPELERRGHVFSSKSDTEVILHLYEEKREQCIPQLDGMFSFAIWNSEDQSALLARDRAGIKPLYYTLLPQGIVFASELKAILAFPGVSRDVSPVAVDAYLTLGYVPDPLTIFSSIRSLPPGHRLLWRNGTHEIRHYWEWDMRDIMRDRRPAELESDLDELLNNAVRSHLVADVPVGAFLSGGIDSSLVSSIARRYTSGPFHTFTIGFGSGDEREYARTVARHIGSIHHEEFAEADLANMLPRLLWHLEQPLFDNSALPTWLVSELARKECKVVLAGDGGDEPGAGYGWTRAAASIPGLPLGGQLTTWKWNYTTGMSGLITRGLYDLMHDGNDRYVRRMTTSFPFRQWLYTSDFAQRMGTGSLDDFYAILRRAPVTDSRDRFVFSDLTAYLPGDVLYKVDRMSMAHGLEVRVPLLDHHLLEWLLRIPWNMRCRFSTGKILLRKVAGRYLPPEILKPRKQGFTVPVSRWLKGPLGDLAEAVFASPTFTHRGIIHSDRARELLALHRSGRFEVGHRIWSLLVLEIWFRVWIDGQSHNDAITQMLKEKGERGAI